MTAAEDAMGNRGELASGSEMSDLFRELKGAARSRGDEVLEGSVDLAQRLYAQAEDARRMALLHMSGYALALRRREEARDRLGAVLTLIHQLGELSESTNQLDHAETPARGSRNGSALVSTSAQHAITARHVVHGSDGLGRDLTDDLEPAPGEAPQPPGSPESPGDSRAGRAPDAPSGPPEPALRARVLGGFSLLVRGKTVTSWNGAKGQSIFKYLLARRGRAVHKEVLMELLWPDGDPEASRRSLHQAVYSLRKTLREADPGASHVLFEKSSYVLNPDLDVWVDATEFEARATTGLRLETSGRLDAALGEYQRANRLYRGPYLEDLLYDDWTSDERRRLWSIFLDVAGRLGEIITQQRRYEESLVLCQKVRDMDPCNESATRLMMRCYHERGQRELAVRQYAILEGCLYRELGTKPTAPTRQLLEDILD